MATPPPFRGRGRVEQRRDDISRIKQMSVLPTRVSGYITINHPSDVDASEATIDLDFPVVFTEKPVFTYGAELGEGNSPLAGQYPTMSAVVASWKTVGAVDGATDGRFVGCRVVTVSTGQAGQIIILHYSFEAKAIRNPIQGDATNGNLGDL